MRCHFCDCINTKVVDSRDSGDEIRRRRECVSCGGRFTTYERAHVKALLVVKRDGGREEFNRQKLWDSLMKACAKRPLSAGKIQKLVDDIEALLYMQGRAELPSHTIGELVMARLSVLDRVAYIRFASVYRDFQDIQSFKTEIDALESNGDSATANQLALLRDDAAADARPKRRRGRPRKSEAALPS